MLFLFVLYILSKNSFMTLRLVSYAKNKAPVPGKVLITVGPSPLYKAITPITNSMLIKCFQNKRKRKVTFRPCNVEEHLHHGLWSCIAHLHSAFDYIERKNRDPQRYSTYATANNRPYGTLQLENDNYFPEPLYHRNLL